MIYRRVLTLTLVVGCEAFTIPHTSRHSQVSFEHYQPEPRLESSLQSTAHDNVESRSGNARSQSISTRQLAMQALTAPPANKKKALENFSPISRLESSPQFLNLEDQRDKSFARHLVSTTMRRMGQIDCILNHVCDVYPPRGKGKQSLILQAALRLGVAQLMFLDTPAFAAVMETVDVLKKTTIGKGQGKGKSDNKVAGKEERKVMPKQLVSFCNAVLRRVDRERDDLLAMTNPRDNVSSFLQKEFIQAYGSDLTNKVIEQLMDESAHQNVDLSLNTSGLKSDKERQAFADKMVEEFSEGHSDREDMGFESIIKLPNGSLRIKKGSNNGSISKWPKYDSGVWWVQDVSSTLPALALISSLRGIHGEENFEKLNVVDMCAAPGGKTAQLLSSGFHVTAIEANARRCRRLLENLERLQLGDKCDVVVSYGQEWTPDANMKVAGILVDVPCSATGTGNRRPDVLQKDEDLGNLLDTQEKLAHHCAENVLEAGAVMVYATCSLLPKESEDQIKRLLQKGNVEISPFLPGEIPGFDDAIDENGFLRVLPGVLDGDLKQCDGFFVARLIKI